MNDSVIVGTTKKSRHGQQILITSSKTRLNFLPGDNKAVLIKAMKNRPWDQLD